MLDVPDEAVIRRRSADQAKSQFNEQNRLWSTANQSSSDSSPSSSDQPTQTATSDEPEAKLKLMTPTDDAQPEVSVEGGSADSTTGSENPGAQASMAMEMAASLEQENTEIRSRLEELESQVETLQKQIALKDAELAELQSKPVEPKPAPAAAVEKPAPAPEPAEEEMPIALYAGGALVLGLLAWLFGRRRKSGSSSPEPKKAARALEDESKPASARPMPEPAATSQPIEVEESTLLSEFTASEFSDLAESQAADPLTETDVYIAYGRYQQAEDLMTAALQDEPDNKTYQLKLLDIYFAAGKAAEFESYAESVQSLEHTDPGTWEQILAMGSELCPASPLFGGSGEAAEPPTEDEPSDEPEIESFELEEPEPAIEEQTESAEDNELEIEVSAPEEQSEEESHKLPDIDNPDVSDFEEQIQTTKEDQTTEQVADAEPAKKADDFEFDFDLIQPDTGGSESTESDDQDRDEASTKLALVQAYLDMEDYESARETLQEVIAIGNDEQRAEAQAKLDRLDS